MPKFSLGRDLDFFHSIARELVDTVIENTFVLFKIDLNATKVNIYGESLNKTWHPGVELFGLVDKDPEGVIYEGFGPDLTQAMTFKVERALCEERNAYPEIGDVRYYDDTYYEIDNTNEIQFVGGQPYNNFSIVCSTFVVREATLNISKRIN
jgi:hypothetical protein